MPLPFILITNDDGIQSAGLRAAAEAVADLGDVLIVAPDRQWSGAGRSMPPGVTGAFTRATMDIGGWQIPAYAVDASPALTVAHAVLEFAPRRPDLVVSGINFGANLGTEVTISGTVGAALEAGAFGIPAIAVSLEMDPAYHLIGNDSADFRTAMAYTRHFAQVLLRGSSLEGIDALSLNVPADATADTPWRLAPLSRRRYFVPLPPDRANGQGRPGYRLLTADEPPEVGSDIWTVKEDGLVAVTPLSLDLTARVDLAALGACLRGDGTACPDVPAVWPQGSIEAWPLSMARDA